METIAKIRRAYFSDCKSIKSICRELRLSRNVVRKVIRSGQTSFSYERIVQPRPKLGPWTAVLEELLETNAAKPAREQLTLIRLFEELRGRGYQGGYDAVRRYAKRWSKERGQSTAAAYVLLSFAPGEAFAKSKTWRRRRFLLRSQPKFWKHCGSKRVRNRAQIKE